MIVHQGEKKIKCLNQSSTEAHEANAVLGEYSRRNKRKIVDQNLEL